MHHIYRCIYIYVYIYICIWLLKGSKDSKGSWRFQGGRSLTNVSNRPNKVTWLKVSGSGFGVLGW